MLGGCTEDILRRPEAVFRLRAPKEDLQYFNMLNHIELFALFQKYRITLKCRISKILVIFQYIEYIALDGPISKI